jgi:hypothetical protein
MHAIHWLTSRESDQPIEKMTCPVKLVTDAIAQARLAFVNVQKRHPSVKGFRILDNSGKEVHRWFTPEKPGA